MNQQKDSLHQIIEKAVTVFLIGYGIHYLAYFLRARYYAFLEKSVADAGLCHVLMYLGHLYFLTAMFLYAWAVKKDRKYIFCFTKGKAKSNIMWGLIGGLVGFLQMGICVLAAVLNGDLEIERTASVNYPIFIFAIFAVLIQASTEEIESRGFVFGKMFNEGVPFIAATVISSFYFSYLHAANPGFGWLALISLFTSAVFYVLCYYYTGSIWFTCLAHMMWNFTEDFILGLPNSGRPAAISLFNTVAKGSSFFYDQTFGIEGSLMTILMNVVSCVLIVLIGRYLCNKKKQ